MRGLTSEVFSGKRAVSKTQAKKLAEFFHVSVEMFIRDSGVLSAPQPWNSFGHWLAAEPFVYKLGKEVGEWHDVLPYACLF